jgi:hypothetical protein
MRLGLLVSRCVSRVCFSNFTHYRQASSDLPPLLGPANVTRSDARASAGLLVGCSHAPAGTYPVVSAIFPLQHRRRRGSFGRFSKSVRNYILNGDLVAFNFLAEKLKA